MKIAFSILFYCCSLTCFSQIQIDSLQSIKLDEILVNPLRNVQPKRKIAQQIESLSKKEIEFQNMPTSADVLANTGKLSIQKSQQGGGSPVIRGFEASRILLLVDGVRMNNLIYRAGHLQNSITVDKNILEKIDVLFGPSSTIFGSDALGGAIYLQTKAAKLLSQIENKKWSGNVMSNYSTVNEGKSAHVDLNFASQQWASLSSVSFNEFGDLKMGKKRNGSNDFFGERPFYVETINGVDQQVANDNKYVQKFSGYKQYDFMQKVVYQPNSNVTHSLNFQYSTTSDIPRYDRLTDLSSNGNLRSAVWKYGPQKRFLSIYKITKDQVFKNTKMSLNVSYQNVEESRINRNFGSSKLNSRIEKVSVIALSSDFTTKINQGNLTYGVDIYRDGLQSTAFQENILTGVETDLDTRYPDGNNTDLPNVAIEDLEINYGSNTIKAATWGRGLWEYSLANRNTFPAIVKTSITNPQSFSMPKASFAQYVTSEIQYTGTLTDVHVSWAINTPAFNATNVIPMSLVSGTTWKSNTPLPDFPVGTKVFFKVFATGSNSDTSETYKFMYDLKVNEFCTASGENTSGALSMTSFSCANLTNNPTVYNAYTNYTTTPIVMHKGSMYTATGVFNQSWTDNDFIVWIDYNNNNEFELSERVVLDINTGNSGTGSFTIPNDAYEGNVRMRVRLGYWGDYTEACGTTLGEVEDYLVTIYPPKPAIIFSGNATACLSDSNELTYTGTPVDSISWVLSNGINTYNFTGNTVNTTTFAIGSYSITINVVKYGLPFSAVFANYLTIANPPTNVDIINADENVACGTIKMITASGGAVTENSITINSGVLNLALPDNSAVGVSKILNVSGLPSSAIITKVNVGFNINHEWLKDVEVVLKAPNGKYIALAADQGPNAVGAYVNTLITSDNSAAALSTLATPITGTYKANATQTQESNAIFKTKNDLKLCYENSLQKTQSKPQN